MPFITQGKANIKYLLIVILVAAISGSFIFVYWNGYRKEIVNLNNFSEIKNQQRKNEIKNQEKEMAKIEEKISDGNLRVVIKISNNQQSLILAENEKEKIIDSCLVKYITKKIEDLAKVCTYNDLSLSPQKNYLIYGKSGFEWGSISLYNIKTGEKKEFPSAHIVRLTEDEKYLFACAGDDFAGEYYGKIYNTKSLEEIYSVPEEYFNAHGIGECSYDKNSNVIIFNSIDFSVPTRETMRHIIEYDLGTKKVEITTYSDWKTYRNANYGFELKYPTACENFLKTGEGNEIVSINTIKFSILNLEDASFSDFMDKAIKESGGDTYNIAPKNISIDGRDGFDLRWDDSRVIYIEKNKKIYKISAGYGDLICGAIGMDVFDTILSTFKFLN